MTKLSIVIVAHEDVAALEQSLVSVLENRPRDCEVVVALAHPYNDPYALAGEVRFVPAERSNSWVRAVNRGLAASCGEIVHVLTSGVEVTPRWTSEALAHFDYGRVAAVAPLVLDSADTQRVLAAGLEYGPTSGRCARAAGRSVRDFGSSPVPVLGPCSTAAFYRRTALETIGQAWDESVGDERADVDLALRLREAGQLALLEPTSRVVAAQCSGCAGATAWSEGVHDERLFWRHAASQGWTRALLAHAQTLFRETLVTCTHPRQAARLLGRAAACLGYGRWQRYQPEPLRAWASELDALEAAAGPVLARHLDQDDVGGESGRSRIDRAGAPVPHLTVYRDGEEAAPVEPTAHDPGRLRRAA